MSKREKHPKKRRQPRRGDLRDRKPITAEQPEAMAQAQPKRGCYLCVFYVSDALLWLRTLVSGFPVPGMCANHTDTPGQWRDAPGKPCRNFRPKPRRVEPPNDQIRYIPLTRGLHAIVDADDYKWRSQYKWQVQPSANHGTWYAKQVYRGRLILMHREIMKAPKGMFVDHINGNGLDIHSGIAESALAGPKTVILHPSGRSKTTPML